VNKKTRNLHYCGSRPWRRKHSPPYRTGPPAADVGDLLGGRRVHRWSFAATASRCDPPWPAASVAPIGDLLGCRRVHRRSSVAKLHLSRRSEGRSSEVSSTTQKKNDCCAWISRHRRHHIGFVITVDLLRRNHVRRQQRSVNAAWRTRSTCAFHCASPTTAKKYMSTLIFHCASEIYRFQKHWLSTCINLCLSLWIYACVLNFWYKTIYMSYLIYR